ncbi:hypothetical protein VCX44_25290, partial [Aeromonas caviae]|nr:hypothetical protein [Aeromonas caviae]
MAQVSGYRFFALSLLLLLAFQVWGAQGRGNITLVSSLETRESPYGRWLDLIYRDAFARLGYDFQYQGYPGGRAQGESVNILLNFTQFFETRIEYRFQIFTAHSCDFLLPSYARLA